MLKLPNFIYRLKIERANVYLWRVLRYALPLFAAIVVGLIGAAPHFARIVF